jgi:hypothetical protein
MQRYSKLFLELALAEAKKLGIKNCKEGIRVYPIQCLEDPLNLKFFEYNALKAEAKLGLPAKLWNEVSIFFRRRFGYEKVLEGLFMAGFSVGYVEGKAELSGNFRRRISKLRPGAEGKAAEESV